MIHTRQHSLHLVSAAARCVAAAVGRNRWFVRRLRPAYESWLEWISGGRGVPWEINGVPCVVDPRQRLHFGRRHEAAVAAFLRERVRPGQVCFDVGASVGVYVLQFAHWSRPDGRVVAFEPNPLARDILAKHVALNGLADRVQIVPHAVTSGDGEQTMYPSLNGGLANLPVCIEDRVEVAAGEAVSSVSLDSFCEASRVEPDWILVDVEGYEFEVLAGARRLIERRRGGLGLVVEMHPWWWEAAGTSRAVNEALLSELGLQPVPLTGQSDPLGEYGLVHLADCRTGLPARVAQRGHIYLRQGGNT